MDQALTTFVDQQKKAREDLSEQAIGVMEKIRNTYEKTNKASLMSLHKIGQMLLDLGGNTRVYGENAVEKIAIVLNLGGTNNPAQEANWFYQVRDIAEKWSQEDLEKLLNDAKNRGVTISRSHLFQLKALPAGQRRKLESEIIKGSLSTRALRERIMALTHKDSTPSAPRSSAAALQQVVSTSDRLIEQIKMLDKKTLRPDKLPAAEATPKTLERMQEARQALERVSQITETRLQQATEMISYLEKRLHGEEAEEAPAPAATRRPARETTATAAKKPTKKGKKLKLRRPAGVGA